ncbi:hypothetical protein [Hyalangium versicolor]|uniref:hypothetical protein n=1 Tax=Hyalangium versicolor TaxID=2861190 RepID=UPI001CCA847E|nr:hypothetical protein [Hyalangium versicolor]
MISRRELLAWAGLSTTNLLGTGCYPAKTPGIAPARFMHGRDESDAPVPAAFILSVDSSGLIHVATRQGQGLGEFKSDSDSQSFNPASLLSDVPPPLQPIARHPLHHAQSLDDPYALDLIVTPHTHPRLGLRSAPQERRLELASDAKFKIPGYFIRLSFEKHYVGGCVKRDSWHAGVLLRDLVSNTLLFDLHVAFWWEQWRPCFAIYESANGFCRNACDQLSWKALIVVIYAALAVTLVAWVAEAIAAAVAAALLGMASILSPF